MDFSEFKTYFDAPDRSILIVCHRDPDFDALGSSLALYHHFTAADVPVTVWCPDTGPVFHSILPGLLAVVRRFPSKFAFNTLLVVDSSNRDRVPDVDQIPDTGSYTTINIDHHPDNTQFGDINLTGDISSVGELLTRLFTQLEWPITPDIASCLYAAISFDTGRFLHSNVTPDTFDAAATLLRSGADAWSISQSMYENQSLNTFKLIESAVAGLVVNDNLKFAYSVIDASVKYDGFKVIDFIRQLGGYEVFVMFRQYSDGQIRINLRSKTTFNVSKFAQQFGGGGHERAAGITMSGDLDTAVNSVITALEDEISR